MFKAAVMDLDMNSVPGQCEMSRFGSTNGEALGWDAEDYSFDYERYHYFKSLVKTRLLDVIQSPVCDEIKIFVKQEPHKKAKVDEGRFRLISAVSLVDSMVDRMLFMRITHRVVPNYVNTGVMIGWNPSAGGFRYLAALFPSGTPLLMADRSSWDWTVQYDMIMAAKEVILRLAVEAPPWWVDAVEHRFSSLFENPVFRFSDGERIVQQQPGIMKSGCYLTILLNSLIQLLLHYELSDNPNIVVLGDDTLQEDEDDEYLEKLRDFGITLKVHRGERIEFAGFYVDEKGYYPAYEDKHVFQLEHMCIDDPEKLGATLENYQILYACVPAKLNVLRSMVEEYGLYENYISDGRLHGLKHG